MPGYSSRHVIVSRKCGVLQCLRDLKLQEFCIPTRHNQLTQTLAFMRLLWAVDHGLRSCSKRMHAKLGLTGPQRLALRMIGSFPGLSLSELADLLHVDRGTLTGILERLVTRGLVLRRLDPTDARRSMLRLSERGRRLNLATVGTIESKIERALASVPATKVEASKSVLEALAAELIEEKARPSSLVAEPRKRQRTVGRNLGAS